MIKGIHIDKEYIYSMKGEVKYCPHYIVDIPNDQIRWITETTREFKKVQKYLAKLSSDEFERIKNENN